MASESSPDRRSDGGFRTNLVRVLVVQVVTLLVLGWLQIRFGR